MLPTSILVPVDFSSCSVRALEYAAELARDRGATVHLLHAIGLDHSELRATLTAEQIESLRIGAYAQLERIATSRTGIMFGSLHVSLMDPREAIIERATVLGVQLIAMGTHGRRGFRRFILGSVTEYVVRHAPCPILSIPEVP